MKKIIILICALIPFFASCEKESKLTLPEEQPKYNLADDPNDPIQHFIYETYVKYGTIVITNPTVADYRFNFNDYNGIEIIAPPQDRAVLEAGINLLKETLFDRYDDDFLKENLPVSIILADIIRMDSYGETYEMDTFVARNYLAISHVNADIADMTDETKNAIIADANSKLWATFMGSMMGKFVLPEEFYQVSDYGAVWMDDPATIDFYLEGFISYDTEMSWIEPEWEWYDVYAPTKEQDMQQWIKFVLGTPKEEIEAICANPDYEKMKIKYEYLSKAMADAGYTAE